MENIMICSIDHFSRQNENPLLIGGFNYRICGNKDLIEDIYTSNFQNKFGNIFINEFIDKPFFYKKGIFKNEEDFKLHIEVDHSFLDNIINFLWFVKDCCSHISITQGFFPQFNANLFEHSNHFFSKADGINTSTEFNDSEIASAVDIFKKLYPQSKDYADNEETFLRRPTGIIDYNNYNYNKLTRIDRAYRFIKTARKNHNLALKIAFNILALECLFSANDNIEINHKLAERISLYIGNDLDDRLIIYKNFSDAYNIRSKYIHGQTIPETKKFKYDSLVQLSIYIDNLLRSIMKKAILYDQEKFLLTSDEQKLWFNQMLFNK